MDRLEKYKKKYTATEVGKSYHAVKDLAVEKERIAFPEQVEIELKVKSIINGCPVLYISQYIIFGKEINKLKKKHDGVALFNELRILDEKWHRRGLNGSLLSEIKDFYVPNYLAATLCRFDVGRFDVNTFG